MESGAKVADLLHPSCRWQEAADLHIMQVQVSLSVSSLPTVSLAPLLLPCSKHQGAASSLVK